jgi:hypothetical protein
MGGDAMRRIDCEPCNNGLSGIDQALAERSLVAISRVAYTPADAFDVALGGEHFHHDQARNLFIEVGLINGLRPVPFREMRREKGCAANVVPLDPLRARPGMNPQEARWRNLHPTRR